MFAEYNKNNAKGTLVGNWVEEEALRNGTGFSRRKVPAPYFAPDMKESRCESTHDRVLVHTKSNSSHSDPSGGSESNVPFETTNQASTRYGEFAVKRELPGPRSSRREMELLEQAKRLCEQQELQRQSEERSQIPTGTLTKASYLPLDPALLVQSTRVPRGRNGARIVDPAIQHLTKREVDSIDQMKLELLQGNAVTRYSHAVATGVGLDGFPVSASDSTNPFGRSSTFTNEIYDPSKRHGEATEPGSDFDERVGTNIHQRSALKRLVQGFQSESVVARELVEKLTSRSQGGFVQISDFRATFAEASGSSGAGSGGGNLGKALGLGDRDVIHAFMHFDVRSIGAIHLPQFLDFCASTSNSSNSVTSPFGTSFS